MSDDYISKAIKDFERSKKDYFLREGILFEAAKKLKEAEARIALLEKELKAAHEEYARVRDGGCLHDKIYSLQLLVNDELVGLSEDEYNKLCRAIGLVSEAAHSYKGTKHNNSSHYEGDFVSTPTKQEG